MESTCHRQGVSKIGVQKAGAPFVPPDWSEKYKPILGPYKQSLGMDKDPLQDADWVFVHFVLVSVAVPKSSGSKMLSMKSLTSCN